MNFGSLLDGIRGQFKARQEQRLGSFEELVLAVADGRQVKADHAADVLEAAGKGPDDLAGAVNSLLHRRKLRALADEGPARQAAYNQVEAELHQAAQDAAKWQAEHNARVGALVARRDAARARLDEATRARADLEKVAFPLAEPARKELLAKERRLRDRREFVYSQVLTWGACEDPKWRPESTYGTDPKQIATLRQEGLTLLESARAELAKLDADLGALREEREGLLAKSVEKCSTAVT